MIRLDLPVNVPPHVCIHVMVRPGRRAWTSNGAELAERRAFREEVAARTPRSARRRLLGPLRVNLLIWRRTSGGRIADGDNLQKEIFDALTEAGVWEDDRQVRACTWTLVEQSARTKPRLVVEVSELDVETELVKGPAVSP